jgi:hypothetical protein
MAMVRDRGPVGQFPYLAGLGLDPEDLGRLDVAAGTTAEGGIYLDAASGDTRLLAPGDPVPDGVWVAQRDLDTITPARAEGDEPHGFGEGWGTQAEQVGGDRSFPEEDAGGERRVEHGEQPEDIDPSVTRMPT